MNQETALTLHRLTVYVDQGPASTSIPTGSKPPATQPQSSTPDPVR